jgi:hypothetical protein
MHANMRDHHDMCTTSTTAMEPTTDGRWVHIGCVVQTDNAFILDTTLMAPVCITNAAIRASSTTGGKYQHCTLRSLAAYNTALCTLTNHICCVLFEPPAKQHVELAAIDIVAHTACTAAYMHCCTCSVNRCIERR